MQRHCGFRVLPRIAAGALTCLVVVTAPAVAEEVERRTDRMNPANEGTAAPRDFEFLYGHWRVHNRRLLKPLQNSEEWVEFAGSLAGSPLLGGLGNYDELRSEESGLLGMSVRYFNLTTRKWSEYWVSRRDGVLQPPVVGSFIEGRAVLEGDDDLHGKSIRVRYIWSRTLTPTPRWEQAFSSDGGKTWETNWVMDFARAEPAGEGDHVEPVGQ